MNLYRRDYLHLVPLFRLVLYNNDFSICLNFPNTFPVIVFTRSWTVLGSLPVDTGAF
uniref:Uncharacterized protein n=1 Tax=Heterorhabditis bacteriophora TaxID=37862 RepID=A0A1I7WVB1_HETBA